MCPAPSASITTPASPKVVPWISPRWHSLLNAGLDGRGLEQIELAPRRQLVPVSEAAICVRRLPASHMYVVKDRRRSPTRRTSSAPIRTMPSRTVFEIAVGVIGAGLGMQQGVGAIALPPNIPHSFRVVGDQPLRLLGTHASPKRIEATSRSRASYWPRRRSLQRREWTSAGRRVRLFLERDGHYWGTPPDDETAIGELERVRRSGIRFVIFAWPAFWWLDH